MKKEAVVVNTARGALIDTVALASALAQGTISGEGLDVFESEPLPEEHPFARRPTPSSPPILHGTAEAVFLNSSAKPQSPLFAL